MLSSEEIDHQLELLSTYRQTLAHLIEQAALHGGEPFAPSNTAAGIREARQSISQIKIILRSNDVEIDDLPSEKPRPRLSFSTRTSVSQISKTSANDVSMRTQVLKKVEAYWIKSVLERSLYQIARIELGIEYDDKWVEHPWDTIVQRPRYPDRLISTETPIIQVFTEIGSEMLILGAPGAGKTTMLLELACNLIDDARKDATKPIPIVLHLSSWSAKQLPFIDWFVYELRERYGVPRKLAYEWISTNSVVPLLDGLDEMTKALRSKCVDEINDFRRTRSLIPLAVCSRIADYEMLTSRLQLRSAIVIQPLTKPQVVDYLKRLGRSMTSVRIALQSDVALWEILDTPLMLGVVILAYKDMPSAIIRAPVNPDEQRKHLFNAYIAAMFERRAKERRYAPSQTIRWLSWLAIQMIAAQQSEFRAENISPGWMSGWRKMLVNIIGSKLSLGLLYGFLISFGASLIFNYDYALVIGLSIGVMGTYIGLARPNASWIPRKSTFSELKVQLGCLSTLILLSSVFVLIYSLLSGFISSVMDIVDIESLKLIILGGVFCTLVILMRPVIHYSSRLTQNNISRLLIYMYGYFPWKYNEFLDYCVDRVFLRKVGDSYIFIHRLLMEHFKSLQK